MMRNPQIVVLISADIEWRAVRSLLPDIPEQYSPLGEWFAHQVAATDGQTWQSIFFHGGWGKIAAAASTQYVIDRWQPLLLVNLGTCGGFHGEVERGDVLLVERTLVYDILEQMGDYQAHIDHYTTLLDLSWLSQPYPQSVRRALLVSADRDLVPAEIPSLKTQYGAIAGDWESGAIAFVAARNQTPLLILRAVSDVVGASGSAAYGDLSVFARAAREILAGLIEALPGWLHQVNLPDP